MKSIFRDKGGRLDLRFIGEQPVIVENQWQ